MNHNPEDSKFGECLNKYFEDILLVIVYHFPFYDSIPLLTSFYKDAFGDILICGPESYWRSFVMKVYIGPGLYGYECLAEAIRRYPGYRGYLYVNDDMIVNWWTFSNLDKEKLWQGGIVIPSHSHVIGSRPIDNSWPWWRIKSSSAEACEDSYYEMTSMSDGYMNVKELVKNHLSNGDGRKLCFRMWSDLFYVPKKFSEQFQRLSFLFHKNRVFLEVAVPTIMSFLDTRVFWEQQYGLYLPDKYGSINFGDGNLVWKEYNPDLKFIHPVKFHGDIARKNREKLKGDIMNYSRQFTKC